MHIALLLYQEYGNVTLVIVKAPTVPGKKDYKTTDRRGL